MIDLHSHILPGLDDGAGAMGETLGMVCQLQAAGFQTLMATPHVLEGRGFLSPEQILAATEEVRREIAAAGIKVNILPGAENYIFPALAKAARAGQLLTLGNTGKYLLLELPLLEIPRYTEQVFFDLQAEGITPVLAHPERYRALAAKPEHLLAWSRQGVLFQVDLLSLNGRYGLRAMRLAEIMLRSGLAHFLGSDAHRVAGTEPGYREALAQARSIVGEEKFQELTAGNAAALLAGKLRQNGEESFLAELPIRKKWYQNLWRRLAGRENNLTG
ncbi:MAG TPA: CpsB/CapC family capsule biosynthesis tyrosine phosphatase [Desulfitobacteriaceae bacterium]|nr:CpsB/CapC family capsule biosynthesis tyrosine phosphatase [Desulfitobacteriaceae bacterium]